MASEDIGLDLVQPNVTNWRSAPSLTHCLTDLPVELLATIFLKLTYKDLKTLSRTCRIFRTILQQPIFDDLLFRSHYQPGAIGPLSLGFAAVRARLSSWYSHGPLFVETIMFPIELHPALLQCWDGGFMSKVFRLPVQLHEDAEYFNEMAIRPTLQRLVVCDKQKKHAELLADEQGVTVAQIIRSVIRRAVHSPTSESDLSGRYPLSEEASIVPAIEGFFRSIALAEGSSLQDILRLLTLWFNFGDRGNVSEAVREGMRTVSVDTWLGVVPQIVARFDNPSEKVRRLIHVLMCELGKAHPQAL
ncbi:phosphatidylinositol kinase- protein kinase tor1, partial [Tilletia horrida]